MPAKDQPSDGFKKPKRGTDIGARIFLSLFGLPFFAVGGFFMYIAALKPIGLATYSLTWEQIDCRILESGVAQHYDEDGYTYSVEVSFEYDWAGQTYVSNRFDFSEMRTGGQKGKRAIAARYEVGSIQRCWVNPNNPERAVISRAIGWLPFAMFLFSGLFVGVGALLMFGGASGKLSQSEKRGTDKGFRGTSRKKSTAKNTKTPTGVKDLRPGVYPDYDPTPLELKPEFGKISGMIGITLFALFWNGIVSVFVFNVVDEMSKGRINWFLVLFLIPFVCVGLALIWGMIYTFLGLFNPKVVLTLTPGTPRLGEACLLSWKFEGNTRRINTFKLVLEAEELATYRRGTSTVTDRNIFEQVVLIDQDKASFAGGGKIDFALPADTAPSFKSNNNKILWTVKVQGVISRWPDVAGAFPIVVLPFKPSRSG